jgi:hypothetical protein
MSFGAVPPFQILFRAQVTPAAVTEKIKRNMPPPKSNYLTAQWRHSTYRNYTVHYSIDPRNIQFTPGTAGFRASIECIAVVYDDAGAMVNSLVTTIPLEVDAGDHDRIMRGGLGIEQTIAIPTQGDFFLRLGVHDIVSDSIGALEVSTEEIKLPAKDASTGR